MYTLKSIARRGSIFGVAAAVVAVSVIPSSAVFADALNPLTERSLMLSSSAPGFIDTDGSGNSNAAPNAINENYAPAGSGPNGKKTGETFTFKVSTTANIKGFSMQYCTTAAGNCQSPGDNTGDARDDSRQDNENSAPNTPDGGHANEKSDLDFVSAFAQADAGAAPDPGEFQIYVNGTPTSVTDWAFTKANLEDDEHSGALTGKSNYVTLTSTTGVDVQNGQPVQLVFRAITVRVVYITCGFVIISLQSLAGWESGGTWHLPYERC